MHLLCDALNLYLLSQLEIVRLRALNRSLSREHGLEEIYNSFESELVRTKQEVEALRSQLEQRRPASRDQQLVSTNSSISAAGRALQRLKKEDDERLALRRENEVKTIV